MKGDIEGGMDTGRISMDMAGRRVLVVTTSIFKYPAVIDRWSRQIHLACKISSISQRSSGELSLVRQMGGSGADLLPCFSASCPSGNGFPWGK